MIRYLATTFLLLLSLGIELSCPAQGVLSDKAIRAESKARQLVVRLEIQRRSFHSAHQRWDWQMCAEALKKFDAQTREKFLYHASASDSSVPSEVLNIIFADDETGERRDRFVHWFTRNCVAGTPEIGSVSMTFIHVVNLIDAGSEPPMDLPEKIATYLLNRNESNTSKHLDKKPLKKLIELYEKQKLPYSPIPHDVLKPAILNSFRPKANRFGLALMTEEDIPKFFEILKIHAKTYPDNDSIRRHMNFVAIRVHSKLDKDQFLFAYELLHDHMSYFSEFYLNLVRPHITDHPDKVKEVLENCSATGSSYEFYRTLEAITQHATPKEVTEIRDRLYQQACEEIDTGRLQYSFLITRVYALRKLEAPDNKSLTTNLASKSLDKWMSEKDVKKRNLTALSAAGSLYAHLDQEQKATYRQECLRMLDEIPSGQTYTSIAWYCHVAATDLPTDVLKTIKATVESKREEANTFLLLQRLQKEIDSRD